MEPSERLSPTTPTTSSTATQPLSKSALKKALKAERYAATKLERRAREKDAKKEKKKLQAEKRFAGELDDGDEEEKVRRKKRPRVQFGGRVVIDLGFDKMMTAKEIKSLCSQLAYTYSTNRQASFPFSLIYTSLDGQAYDRLESLGDAGYKRWANTEWWHEGFERLWLGQPRPSVSPENHDESGSAELLAQSLSQNAVLETPSGLPIAADGQDNSVQDVRQNIVYLTADSEDELSELKADETYIIGGICDHNRYKNLCLNKAKDHDIRSARLPIGRYLASLPTRKVLTVNQVFEILAKWVETRDWEESLYSVIPKRKFQQRGGPNQEANAGEIASDVPDSTTTDEAEITQPIARGPEVDK